MLDGGIEKHRGSTWDPGDTRGGDPEFSMRVFFALMVVHVTACTSPPSSDPVDTAVPTADTATTPSTTTTDTTPVEPGEPGVTGRLVGPDGEPMPAEPVLCCQQDSCAVGETGIDGTFSFAEDPGTLVAVKTHHDLYKVPRHGAALAPAEIVADGTIELGDVYVPALPAGVPVGTGDEPRTLDVGGGVELTVVPSDLVPDLGVVLYDLAAAPIEEPWIPHYPDAEDRDVVAVFAMHPFATRSESPVSLSLPSDLAAGTEVSLFWVSHLDGTLSEPVPGVADGAQVTTEAGEGLEWLTHVVVTVP